MLINNNYYCAGYIKNDRLNRFDFRPKYGYNVNDGISYLYTEIIGNYKFKFDTKDLFRVGHIDCIGKLLDYDILANVVNSELDNNLLKLIMKAVKGKIWNNREEFIVVTVSGIYYVVVTECEDVDVMRKALAINKASVIATSNIGQSYGITTPLRNPNVFKQTMQRCYDIDFKDIKNGSSLINYNTLSRINISTRLNQIKVDDNYNNYQVLELLLNEYEFI